MPEAERRVLVETIEKEFGDFPDELAPGEAELIDRRLREHLTNPDDVVPLEAVKAKLDARYRK
jgi:hypothetical protein